MTENKDTSVDKETKSEGEILSEKSKGNHSPITNLQPQAEKKTKEQSTTKSEQSQQQPHSHSQHDRGKRLSYFLDMLNIPRHHHHHHHHHAGGHGNCSNSVTSSQQHSPQTAQSTATTLTVTTSHLTVTGSSGRNNKNTGPNSSSIKTSNSHSKLHHLAVVGSSSSDEQEYLSLPNAYLPRSSCVSFQSEIILLDLINGGINESVERPIQPKDDCGTQRVYKKTSPNCVLTLYLPSREITLSGSSPSILRGIVFVDPKAIQGYRVYAQLTLTFRYGREDEEVMGLRFCNEAIMSLHQIWPRNEEPNKESLSPLQEALLKRLGDGAHPFTLTLTAQAPPSVQLVPAKRYYGAPIGTSYDVRCFIADKSDEKFHRRASVKMGVRVIYRTDVFNHGINGPENFAASENNSVNSPPPEATAVTSVNSLITSTLSTNTTTLIETQSDTVAQRLQQQNLQDGACADTSVHAKVRKSERVDSFPKLRLSPKTFRFSNRFGRSKSEVEKYPNDPSYNYSKSFQEYDSICTTNLSGGPQGAVDKPFLLQDGRVGLRASLDKSWYTHGENVCVTINIRNDSRKTVRKVRVCAIQHVDVCMFNNGKFKNVVADSDSISPPPIDQHVAPGSTLKTTVILKPQRGATKNWIALEDTLQRSTEPDEITADIAASALRTPHFLMQANHSPNKCSSPGVLMPPTALTSVVSQAATNSDERNVFAIYVSYYVKVKLTLSSMGGELSLKLPFLLVHIDEEQRLRHERDKITLEAVPSLKRNGKWAKSPVQKKDSSRDFVLPASLERIESLDTENVHIKVTHVSSCEAEGIVVPAIKSEEHEDDIIEEPQPSTSMACRRRRQSFMRCESIDHGLVDDYASAKPVDLEQVLHLAQVHHESPAEEETTSVANKS